MRADHNDVFTSTLAMGVAAGLRQSSHYRARRPNVSTVAAPPLALEPGPPGDRFFKPMGRGWLDQAACRDADPKLFEWDEEVPFELSPEWMPAEWYCDRCPVRGPCREAGRGLPGMWGGTPNLIRKLNIAYNGSGVQVGKRDALTVTEAAASATTTEEDGRMTTIEKPLSTGDIGAPTATLRTMTPEMARTWLAANDGNRNLSKPLVSQYARDMAAGRWELNGEAVQISATGKLLNGQHRLHAIIQAGVTVPLVVVTNLDDTAQQTMDKGRKRNLADALALAGYTGGVPLASIAQMILQMRNGRMYRASDAEKREFIDSDETLRWVCANVVGTLPRGLASRTVLGYAYYVLHQIDVDACSTFFSKLDTLTNLPEGSPILALHKRLSAMDRRSSAWSERTYVLALLFTAWNAWRRDERRTMMKLVPREDGSYNVPKPV